ncbi:fluoride efflux transporter CrcB [Maricaulis sp.]|uniref:fluoride efflux transporter CrcB n=1 Tax=Maricaulis sp. TaxID=1486257 RepID=UPI00261204B3|nr:fluoride efflux transporter CrcB [Maricaulis sp.]
MNQLLLIGAGGAIGAVSRHLVGQLALRLMGPGLPWGTFAVNIVGGLAMGLLVGWLAMVERADEMSIRLFAGVGVLGGFTTFSAFSLDLVLMIERRDYTAAMGYALASVLIAVLALMAGLMIARRLQG